MVKSFHFIDHDTFKHRLEFMSPLRFIQIIVDGIDTSPSTVLQQAGAIREEDCCLTTLITQSVLLFTNISRLKCL